jgi:hypothetical protein
MCVAILSWIKMDTLPLLPIVWINHSRLPFNSPCHVTTPLSTHGNNSEFRIHKTWSWNREWWWSEKERGFTPLLLSTMVKDLNSPPGNFVISLRVLFLPCLVTSMTSKIWKIRENLFPPIHPTRCLKIYQWTRFWKSSVAETHFPIFRNNFYPAFSFRILWSKKKWEKEILFLIFFQPSLKIFAKVVH